MHPAAARRLLYFLLVTLLINAGGWTFNREAVADAFFAGQETVPAEIMQPSLQAGHGHGESPKAKAVCTHWCHEVGHFLGLFGQTPSLSSKPIEGYSYHNSRFIPEPAPEGLFRPPRLIS
ncbi:MAG: hypothetical protein ABIK08_11885 [Pseudomonadota bacterium]